MRIPDKYNTVFTLDFADPELAELEVKVRRSFGLIDAAADLAHIDLEAVKAGKAGPEDLRRQRELVDAFAGAVVSWNLEGDDGELLPSDRDTVRGLDVLFVAEIVAALMGWLNQESTALVESAGLHEATLPMEIPA